MISHARKGMFTILQMRLQRSMNWELPGVQAWFRKARGTRDQIANMFCIIKKAGEFQESIYYIAYAKAFDCLDHNKLWKILEEMGIPDHLICLLKNLYAAQDATVRTRHGMTDWFKIGKGICQGCILSPSLFNIYAEFSSVQMLSHIWLFVTPWTVARQTCCPSPIPGVYSNACPLNSIQPSSHLMSSHPLLSPSPLAFNLSQHQGLFKWVGSSQQVANVLEFELQHQAFQWTFRTYFL